MSIQEVRLLFLFWLFATAVPNAQAQEPEPEAYDTGWTVHADNDLLFPVNRDQQYTGGIAVTLAGRRAREYWFSLDPLLNAIDGLIGFDTLYDSGQRYQLHSFSFGVAAFTPADTATPDPIYTDRPYSNEIFIANTQLTALIDAQVLYHSNFSLGLIGTNAGRELQRQLHRGLANEIPRGWDNQISDGGELTLKYTLTRQDIHSIVQYQGDIGGELRSVLGGSLGTTTELGFGFGGRWGRITTPWWEFAPVFGDYINLGTPFASRPKIGLKELYLWGGVIVRFRIYNALLQGQFRDSLVTFDDDQLNRTVTELAFGVTWEPVKQWTLSLSLRARSPEFKGGEGLDAEWGSLTLSRCY